MDIAVLGATGRTGVPFAIAATAAGHRVRALVRTPSKRSLLPAAVEVVEGDATDAAAVDRLVEGADAVIDLIAPERGAPDDLRRTVVEAVLDAMRRHDVTRLVLLTGAGVRVEDDEPKLLDRFIVRLMRVVAADVLADGERAVSAVRDSDTDWTVVRAPRLTDDEGRGDATASAIVGPDSGTKVSRADLAAWLLDELEDPSWVHAFPVVTW